LHLKSDQWTRWVRLRDTVATHTRSEEPNERDMLMQTRYQARWLSKPRRDQLRRSGASTQGILLDSLKGFVIVEPVGSNLGDAELLTPEEADFELSDAWCLDSPLKLREARKRLGLEAQPESVAAEAAG
jgi:hypothetical protein